MAGVREPRYPVPGNMGFRSGKAGPMRPGGRGGSRETRPLACGPAPICGGLSAVKTESPQEAGAVSAFEMVHQDQVVGKLVGASTG